MHDLQQLIEIQAEKNVGHSLETNGYTLIVENSFIVYPIIT